MAHSKAKVSRRSSQPLHTEWSIKALTPREDITQIQSADGAEEPAGELQDHQTEAVSASCEQKSGSSSGMRHAVAAGPALHEHQHSAALTSNFALLENDAQWEASDSGQQGSAHEGSSEGGALTQTMVDSRLAKNNEGASSIEGDHRGSREVSGALNSSLPRARQLGSARGQGLASMASMQELPATSSSFRAQTVCAASIEAPGKAPAGGVLIRASEQHQGVDGSRQSMHLDDGLAASSHACMAEPSRQSMPSRGSPSSRPSTSHFSVQSGSRSPDTRMHVHRYSTQHAVANSDSGPADKQASARVGPLSNTLACGHGHYAQLYATPALCPCIEIILR